MSKTCSYKKRSSTQYNFDHTICLFGILLLLLETTKQLFLYYNIFGKTYRFWYFPFQLCSVPMYICLIIPHINKQHIKLALITFVRDYSLLGGICALIVSEGFKNIHWLITLHGYTWHIMLIFLSIYITISLPANSPYKSVKFKSTFPVLFTCILIATFINIITYNISHTNYSDMFYLNPYIPSEQPIAHSISLSYGYLAGHAIYLAALILGGFFCHILLNTIAKKVRAHAKDY